MVREHKLLVSDNEMLTSHGCLENGFKVSRGSIVAPKWFPMRSLGALSEVLAVPWELVIYLQGQWIVALGLSGLVLELPSPCIALLFILQLAFECFGYVLFSRRLRGHFLDGS